jgi:hypothetical protein
MENNLLALTIFRIVLKSSSKFSDNTCVNNFRVIILFTTSTRVFLEEPTHANDFIDSKCYLYLK